MDLEELVVDNAKKGMLDSINKMTDIDFIKLQLKKQLQKNWQLEEENKMQRDIIIIFDKEINKLDKELKELKENESR